MSASRSSFAHNYFRPSLRILFTAFLETKPQFWKLMSAISWCCIGSSGSPLHPPLLLFAVPCCLGKVYDLLSNDLACVAIFISLQLLFEICINSFNFILMFLQTQDIYCTFFELILSRTEKELLENLTV